MYNQPGIINPSRVPVAVRTCIVCLPVLLSETQAHRQEHEDNKEEYFPNHKNKYYETVFVAAIKNTRRKEN